jgi:uncharacterized membrane protein
MTDDTPPVTPPPAAPPPAAPAGTGLEPNVAGALSYILGALTGILFLVVDGQRPFVRFHAMQSIVLTVTLVVLWIVLGVAGMVLAVIPIIGWLIGILLSLGLSLGGLILWLYLMYRAWSGDEWAVPFVGRWTRQIAGQDQPVARD